MAITEKSRHELYRRLEEILGADQATTLMEHLPPVGWADVATKDDLHQLESRLGTRIDGLDVHLGARIDSLDSRVDSLDARLGARIDSLDSRIDGLDARLGARIDSLDSRVDSLDGRLTSQIDSLDARLGGQIDGLRAEMHSTLRTNGYLVVGAMAALVTLVSAIGSLT